VRQGEIGSHGKWQGSASGGVKTPEAILLPDPTSRFVVTAARLEALADGHPMAAWLHFMAAIAQAQQRSMMALLHLKGPDLFTVAQSVEARMPPIAADGHRRDPVWREGLTLLLDSFDNQSKSQQVQTVIARLRNHDVAAIESLADAFLYGSVEKADAGLVLYVAAALQVYFTRMAAALPLSELRLLPQRGLCPCCGSTPISGLVTATGQSPGTRYLYCSICSTAWNHVRAMCITCGGSRAVSLEGVEDDAGIVKAETCGDCRTYAKMIYQAQDTRADPFADDLASLGLDMLVGEAGWSRHAPNPLLLVG